MDSGQVHGSDELYIVSRVSSSMMLWKRLGRIMGSFGSLNVVGGDEVVDVRRVKEPMHVLRAAKLQLSVRLEHLCAGHSF